MIAAREAVVGGAAVALDPQLLEANHPSLGQRRHDASMKVANRRPRHGIRTALGRPSPVVQRQQPLEGGAGQARLGDGARFEPVEAGQVVEEPAKLMRATAPRQHLLPTGAQVEIRADLVRRQRVGAMRIAAELPGEQL